MAAFVLLLPILGSYDPRFYTASLTKLKVLYYAGTTFVGLLWLTRMLIQLATRF
jgi:hypothetical protein